MLEVDCCQLHVLGRCERELSSGLAFVDCLLFFHRWWAASARVCYRIRCGVVAGLLSIILRDVDEWRMELGGWYAEWKLELWST